ncbi:MAG: CBS domain-containing protein [Candidatus Aenigmatarchaeota archaeon]
MVVKLKDIMSTTLNTIDENKNIIDAAKKMKKVSSLLVKRKGKIYGIITDTDIVKKVVAKGLDPKRVKVKQIASTPLITLDENEDVRKASYVMIKNGIKRIVVTRNGKVVGIVTATDIARYIPDYLDVIEIGKKYMGVKRPILEDLEDELLIGECEECGNLTSDLKLVSGRWLCESCREEWK